MHNKRLDPVVTKMNLKQDTWHYKHVLLLYYSSTAFME